MADQGSVPTFAVDDFPGQAIPVTLELDTPVATLQVSGVTGSALELVGPVSAYCGQDGKFESANSFSISV